MKRHTVSQMKVFYSYAPEDEKLRQRLEKHLSLLEREGWIYPWHHRLIPAGTERIPAIYQALDEASIVLLLISSDFLASHRCYNVEMLYALQCHQRGTTRVIPIILKPCDWKSAPFAELECLPRGGKAVTEWNDQDSVWRDIVYDLRQVIQVPEPIFPWLLPITHTSCMWILFCVLCTTIASQRFHMDKKWSKIILIGIIGMLAKVFPYKRVTRAYTIVATD